HWSITLFVCVLTFFFLLLILPPPTPTLFPYTTLFRSFGRILKQAGELFAHDRAHGRHHKVAVHHADAGLYAADPAHAGLDRVRQDRKSTRLNSSHVSISYAVFCLKKKKKTKKHTPEHQ